MHYHTIIIGAGPAGLFAAQHIGKQNKKVLLLERNEKAGKKLLISGSGQCNFTHQGDLKHYLECYGDHGKFLKKSLSSFTYKDTISFFESLGVTHEVMPNGKIFPKSRQSKDILEALIIACHKANVTIRYNSLVTHIEPYDGVFAIEIAEGKRYFCDHVIMATGGKSYPKTGSDGQGYTLAEKLGHTICSLKPALTDVSTKEKNYSSLMGVSFQNVHMDIYHEGKKIKEHRGDLLFTHKGLSGPVIIDTSRWINKGDRLVFNFLYPRQFEEVKVDFAQNLALRGKEELITYLKKLQIPKSFCQLICQISHLDEHITCAQIDKKSREKLVRLLTAHTFEVEACGGFHLAMVTAGGVHLKEVNPCSLESRLQKGLYFIGEVLDIDGNTGGYNIQAAFSMAYMCSEAILKN
ncbi:aminoacetone oxidase family FAD-binding enzyme [Sporanaerobium hydrogeniformans]|uniref:Aminoacetone oxidase family FAD-binding enzyme n=1 Tax=Sporanaerobium hydrogeniformans TaxID=3072179 RepID=A0AC61DBH9_9FIRM|nr:NAD(P)/FAD-dependent oxidoreductase [Sporanaerobium hydrogeniformans]PHV70649.1 aminoacetone oxidase family FAD-binding enzyme [Sporanaerobium hydrogeniformans]